MVIIVSLYLSFRSDLRHLQIFGNQTLQQKQIRINDVIIKIEVADTPKLRRDGLGGRESLPEDAGMLFIFPEAKKYQFWMKGVKFPLDFIFIADGRVVDIIKNAPVVPEVIDNSSVPRYQSNIAVNRILEVNAGFVNRNNIKVGDNVYEVK